MARYANLEEAVLAVRPTIVVWAELEDEAHRRDAFEYILQAIPDPVAPGRAVSSIPPERFKPVTV